MVQQLGSLEKVLRAGEGRRLKRLAEQAAYIGTLEPEFEQLSDADLAAKTADFRQRLENGESLDDLVFEAFAAVREAFKRTMGVRLFDVQLMGGIVLHEGDIAENQVAEATVWLKGHTLRAREATRDMKASIDELTEKLQRQVKDERVVSVDGQRIFGSIPALEARGKREGRDYAVHAERLDGDLWEVRASAL